MFTVDDNITVRFGRSEKVGDEIVRCLDGRKTVCYVHIVLGDSNEYEYQGVAVRNPKDQNDKVTGKKLALMRALSHGLDKATRRRIWQAFFAWVESWKVSKT